MPSHKVSPRALRHTAVLVTPVALAAWQAWRVQRAAVQAESTRYAAQGPLPARPVASRVHTVVTPDGVELKAELFVPVETRRSAPTIVLIHGYTLDSHSWTLLVPGLLAAGYPVVTYDSRGHGDSDRGDWERLTFSQMADDLAQVCREVALPGPVALVGHSMGGMIMLELGARHPDLMQHRVAAAAFVATSSGGLGSGLTWVPIQLGRLVATAYASGPRVLASLLGYVPAVKWALRRTGPLGRAAVGPGSFGGSVPMPVLELTTRMILGTPVGVVLAMLPEFSRLEHQDRCDRFASVETLIFHGDKDLLTPVQHSEHLAASIPGARHVCVPGAGHIIMLERPEELLGEILALLDRAQARHTTIQETP